MADWQPIETAPKDGTEFLACELLARTDAPGYWDKFVCAWGNGYGWHSDGHRVAPTHWQPWPADPETGGDPT